MANLLSSLPAFLPVAWMLFHAPGHAMFPAGSTSVPTAFARTAWSAVVTTLAATALAAAGQFSLPALLGCNLLACGLGLLARRLAPATGRHAHVARDPVGVAVVILALASWWPAWPMFLGASDSTAYLATGISVAHHGTLWREDDLVSRVPLPLRPILFDSMDQVFGRSGPPYRRAPGAMMIDSLAAERAWPDFFPVPAAWAATFTVADVPGVTAPEQGAPGYAAVFAALALWAFSLVAREWMGTAWGLAATALLGGSVPFVLGARMPLSEPIAAFFCWTGLATLVSSHPQARGRDALLAGAALGCAVFTRMEVGMLLAMAFALQPFLERRARARTDLAAIGPWSAGPQLLGTIALVASATILLARAVPGQWSSHFADHLWNAWSHWLLFRGVPSAWSVLLLLAGGAVLAALLARRVGWSALLRAGFFAGVLAAHAAASNPLPTRTPMWMAFAVGPSTLALAVVGALLLTLRRMRKPASSIVLAFVLSTAAILVWNPHVLPALPWAWRRFVPVLLPGCLLLATLALSLLWERRGFAPRSLALAGLVATALLIGQSTKPLLGRELGSGAWEQLAALNAAIPRDGTVLVDRDVSPMMVAPALWLVHDRNNLTVPPSDSVVARKYVPGLVWEFGRTSPVYLVTRGAGSQSPLPWVDATLLKVVPAGFPLLEQSYDRAPRKIENYQMPLAVYRLQPGLTPKGTLKR